VEVERLALEQLVRHHLSDHAAARRVREVEVVKVADEALPLSAGGQRSQLE